MFSPSAPTGRRACGGSTRPRGWGGHLLTQPSSSKWLQIGCTCRSRAHGQSRAASSFSETTVHTPRLSSIPRHPLLLPCCTAHGLACTSSGRWKPAEATPSTPCLSLPSPLGPPLAPLEEGPCSTGEPSLPLGLGFSLRPQGLPSSMDQPLCRVLPPSIHRPPSSETKLTPSESLQLRLLSLFLF